MTSEERIYITRNSGKIHLLLDQHGALSITHCLMYMNTDLDEDVVTQTIIHESDVKNVCKRCLKKLGRVV